MVSPTSSVERTVTPPAPEIDASSSSATPPAPEINASSSSTTPILKESNTETSKTAEKVSCTAIQVFHTLGSIILFVMSASTLPLLWTVGGFAAGAVITGILDLSSNNDCARFSDVVKIGASTAAALFFPVTMPWSALAATAFFGNLAYRLNPL